MVHSNCQKKMKRGCEMKKILLLALLFLVTFSVWSLQASAEGELEGELEEGLAPGETVVDSFTEVLPGDTTATEGTTVLTPGNLPTTDARRLSWYPVSKTYVGEVGSKWYYAGASTQSGGTLHASHTNGVAHTFSGQLESTISRLTGFIGFNTTRSFEQTVSYSTKEYASGKYRLEYQHRYVKYKVKQEKKYDSRSTIVHGTAYVYPQKWVERRYRVVKLP